jgi:hypothetical protein
MAYKLYSQEEEPKLSMEEFCGLYGNISSIATESVLDYMFALKDKLSFVINSIYNLNNDIITTDVSKYRAEAISRAKKLPMSAIANRIVAKPLNFSGVYIDYTPVLSKASWAVIRDLDTFLTMLIRQVTEFINNTNTDVKTLQHISPHAINESEKLTNEVRDNISSYFKLNNNSSRGKFSELYIAPADLEKIYKDIDDIDSAIDSTKLSKLIEPKTKQLYELVSVLAELESKQKLFDKANNTKKMLVKSLSVAAQETETLAYIYTNINILYTAIRENCKDIIEVSKSI